MKHPGWGLCSSTILLLGLLVGCGGTGGDATCKRTQDCPADELCIQTRCQLQPKTGCASGQDCAPGEHCTKGTCKSLAKCQDGETRVCYPHVSGCIRDEAGSYRCQGLCKTGTQRCRGGSWLPCQGKLGPRLELCDGLDNNCDGKIDESANCICKPGAQQRCYTGPADTAEKGSCRFGLQTCEQDHRWGSCIGQVLPQGERCNGEDDDCNGMIDEDAGCACKPGNRRTCYRGPANTLGVGSCKAGEQRCTAAYRWSACEGESVPSQERCNGLDDDCDGAVDEIFARKGEACQASPTACGKRVCKSDGSGLECKPTTGQPAPEICNGKDDDCDGIVDDGVVGCAVDLTGVGALTATQDKVFGHIVVDTRGNIFVVDSAAHRLRKIDPQGRVTTVAGDGKCTCLKRDPQGNCSQPKDCFRDGPGEQAQFNRPTGLAMDKAGNLYIADTGNHRIRKMDPLGQVTTLAGDGACRCRDRSRITYPADPTLHIGFCATKENCYRDGPGKQAQFFHPMGLAFDGQGTLYVADTGNHVIRRITTQGDVSTFAGDGKCWFFGQSVNHVQDILRVDNCSRNGPRLDAQFFFPADVALDKEGALYVVDSFTHTIRKIGTDGQVSTFAGAEKSDIDSGRTGNTWSGTSSYEEATLPGGGDKDGERGIARFFFGNTCGKGPNQLGPCGTSAMEWHARGTITLDVHNNVYVGDIGNDKIRMINPKGVVSSLLAGAGSISTDGKGDLYIATTLIRKLTRHTAKPCNQQGAQRECYHGTSGTPGVGVCQKGRQHCAYSAWGTWSACYGERTPQNERCSGQDDDCNGQIDDNAKDTPRCPKQYGICKGAAPTTPRCTNGMWVCTGSDYKSTHAKYETTEVSCDGLDNDCDGLTDEGIKHCVRPITSPPDSSDKRMGCCYDGRQPNAKVGEIGAIAVFPSGDVLFYDSTSQALRKVTSSSEIQTLYRFVYGREETSLDENAGIVIDASGALFYFDHNPDFLQLSTTGILSFASTKGTNGAPYKLATSVTGELFLLEYASDGKHLDLLRRAATGTFTRVLDGTKAGIQEASGLAIDASGQIYISQASKHRILRFHPPTQQLTTFAGSGQEGSKDAMGLQASFSSPGSLVVDGKGQLYVADNGNYKIRKIDRQGNVTTLAGTGLKGNQGGMAIQATFGGTLLLALNATGHLYIADTENRQIRMIPLK